MEHQNPKPQWADIKQASQIMGVPDHVIRRACHRGQLTYKKIGRKMLIPMNELTNEKPDTEKSSEKYEQLTLF